MHPSPNYRWVVNQNYYNNAGDTLEYLTRANFETLVSSGLIHHTGVQRAWPGIVAVFFSQSVSGFIFRDSRSAAAKKAADVLGCMLATRDLARSMSPRWCRHY